MLQARSQLKAIYKDNADTIIGNMDSQVFLGGSEPTTLKELAEALGKETIDILIAMEACIIMVTFGAGLIEGLLQIAQESLGVFIWS